MTWGQPGHASKEGSAQGPEAFSTARLEELFWPTVRMTDPSGEHPTELFAEVGW